MQHGCQQSPHSGSKIKLLFWDFDRGFGPKLYACRLKDRIDCIVLNLICVSIQCCLFDSICLVQECN